MKSVVSWFCVCGGGGGGVGRAQLKRRKTCTRSQEMTAVELELSARWPLDSMVVVDSDAYRLTVHTVNTEERSFRLLSVEMRVKQCKEQTATEVFTAVDRFIVGTADVSPNYLHFDMHSVENYSLGAMQHAASVFGRLRELLQTRLVGTILSNGTIQDSTVSGFLKKYYRPVRPVCWFQNTGDAVQFVETTEREL